MIPGAYTIQAYRNDTLQLTFTITDGSAIPIDLNTATMKMQIRNRPDGDVLQTLTEGDGLTVSGAGNNIVTVSKVISIESGGVYTYDLQATFASGVVTTYVKGNFILFEDVTK